MRLIDLGDKSQADLVDTGKDLVDDSIPVFDRGSGNVKKTKKDFGEFKFE